MIYFNKIVICVVLSNLITFSIQNENNKNIGEILCGDENCKIPISIARTVYKYTAETEGKISFEPGRQAKIYAKYNEGQLYEIDVGGRRGWAPMSAIKEATIKVKTTNLIKVPIPESLKQIILSGKKNKLQASEISPEVNKIEQKTVPLPGTGNKLITGDYSNMSDSHQTVNNHNDTITSEEKKDSNNQYTETVVNTTTTIKDKAVENSIKDPIQQVNHFENIEHEETNDLVNETVYQNLQNLNHTNNNQNISDNTEIKISLNAANVDPMQNKIALDKTERKISVTKSNDKINDHLKVAKDLSNNCTLKLHFLHIIETINQNEYSKETIFRKNQEQNLIANEDKAEIMEEKISKNENETEENSLQGNILNEDNKIVNENLKNNLDEVNEKKVFNFSEHSNMNTESNLVKNEKENKNHIADRGLEAVNVSKTADYQEIVLATTASYDENNINSNEKIENSSSESVLIIANKTENEHEETTSSTTVVYESESSHESEFNISETRYENVLTTTTTTDYNTDNSYSYKENETTVSASLELDNSNLTEANHDDHDDVVPTTINNDVNNVNSEKSHTESEQSHYQQESADDNLKLQDNKNNEISEETASANLEPQDSEISGVSDLPSNQEIEKNLFDITYEFVSNLWSSTLDKMKYNVDENVNDSSQDAAILNENKEQTKIHVAEDGYCEKLNSNSCPKHMKDISNNEKYYCNENDLFSSLSDKIVDIFDIFICIVITAITSLIFAFGYYCICHNRNEQILLSKLNIVERSLMASNKESSVLKHELLETKSKLSSIEDNSFGSNDMIVMLKKEIEIYKEDKEKLQEQVATLEKELENAAEAGLELNKIVSELLSNQSGEDSIISSVEELQKQLNEQQNTILQINATLAEKSKENSELQLLINEKVTKFEEEVNNLKQKNEVLESEKIALVTQLEQMKNEHIEQMSKIVEDKSIEYTRMNEEIVIYKTKYEDINKKLQASDAKIQVLEEYINSIKNKLDIKKFLDVVNLKTENLVLIQEKDSLKERLETEVDTRKMLENRVKIMSEEIAALKQEYNQSEKEKLEARTRLEVLSSYFKEKETQLQKELSIKEAMWLKQQGETTNTVERVRLMQDEIQSLRSQNDSLRAEIEAQNAAHKAQIASLENRTHETWLAARHSERKYEEARSEASALRRKLTSLGTNSILNETDMFNRSQNTTDGLMNQINNASSPIHMESPGSPLLGNLPPPSFLPPPFMVAPPPPPPFMTLPPPLVPPSEMRPPPLGRLMSPPPPPPHHHNAYSPGNVDDDDRHRYSPDNGRYSPDDSHYNYNTDLMSAYDTETDFSLPPSPQTRMTDGDYRKKERITYKEYSPSTGRNRKLKGTLSSGSEESFNVRKNKSKNKTYLETDEQ